MNAPKTAAAMVSLSLLLGACGASGGDDVADDATTSTTTDVSTSTTDVEEETTTTTGANGDGDDNEGVDTETSVLDMLPDGDHYGYMAGLEKGTVEGQAVQVIIFDKVDFLTGAEAVAAAQEDGVIPTDQDFIENDYYIRNENQTVRRLAVVPDGQVFTLSPDGGSEQVPSSVDEVWQQEYLFKINVGNVRDITTVSSIEAVFLP